MIKNFEVLKKMTVRIAAYLSVGFSIGALVICMISVPMIYSKILSINQELKADMDEFNLIYEETWKEIKISRQISLGGAKRTTRQASGSQCQCNRNNNCPPGAAGK